MTDTLLLSPIVLSAKRTGFTPGGFYAIFEARFSKSPTLDDLCEAQSLAGYHPAGYGMPMDRAARMDDAYFVATWRCINSSD